MSPGVEQVSDVDTTVRRWLGTTWWLICPTFLLLVGAFIVERACFDRYLLLPGIGARPRLAWLVAGVYVGAHCWGLLLYCVTVRRTGELLPSPRRLVDQWPHKPYKVLLMLGLLALEYVPAALWVGLGRLLVPGC